jgi:hypothetical protein
MMLNLALHGSFLLTNFQFCKGHSLQTLKSTILIHQKIIFLKLTWLAHIYCD